MKQIIKRIEKDIREYGMFGVALAVYYLAARALFHAFCPMVIATGIPCPGCGMTRALLFFVTGQWERSWNMNPLAVCWVALAVYFVVMRYFLGEKPKGILPMIYAVIAMMAVLYAWRMIREFPGTPPISYTGNNLLEKILPGYRQFMLQGRFLEWF